MKFELGKKARNTGIRDYIISIIAILICIDVSTVMLMRNDFSYFILTVTWLLALPISIILFKSGLKYLTSDGK